MSILRDSRDHPLLTAKVKGMWKTIVSETMSTALCPIKVDQSWRIVGELLEIKIKDDKSAESIAKFVPPGPTSSLLQ